MSVADVVIIGAGSNGLAAAAVLSRAGKKVIVLERSAAIGGQFQMKEFAKDFQMTLKAFDTGWITPAVAAATGVGIPRHSSPNIALAVSQGESGREVFGLPVSASQAAAAISQRSPSDAKKFGEFAQFVRSHTMVLEKLYQLPAPNIEMSAPGEVLPFASIAAGLRLGTNGAERVGRLLRTLPLTAQDFGAEWFEDSGLRAIVAAGGVQGIKQGPRSGGTTFVLLHHLVGAHADSIRARPYLTESPDAFVAALAAAVLQRGGIIRTGTAARAIVVNDYRVTGVETDAGEVVACDAVIAATDPKVAMLDLLPPEWIDPDLRRAVSNIRMRGCSAFVSYALRELPESLVSCGDDVLRSVISLSPSADTIERSHDAAKHGRLADAPHIEVAFPSFRWEGMARAGGHTVMARVHHVPFAASESEITARSDSAIEHAFPGFADRIVARSCLGPARLEVEYGITEGALSHGELGLDQVLFMRPVPQLAAFRTPIDGYFLSGSGCHPGPGLPGGAGVLAARALTRAESRG